MRNHPGMRGRCERLRYSSTFVQESKTIHTNPNWRGGHHRQWTAFLTIYNQPPLSGKTLPSRVPLLPHHCHVSFSTPSRPPTAKHDYYSDRPPTPRPHSSPHSGICTGSSAPPAGSLFRTTSESCSYTPSHSRVPPDSGSNPPAPGSNRRYTLNPRVWSSR